MSYSLNRDDIHVGAAGHAGGTHDSATEEAGSLRRRGQVFRSPQIIALSLVTAALGLAADQLTKALVINHYAPDQVIADLALVRLVFVVNHGGICGYAQGAGTLLAALGGLTALLIALAILFLLPPGRLYAVAFGLLLAGAAGNLIDRLRWGFVVDLISVRLPNAPSFNLADAAIVAGIATVALLTWQTERTSGSPQENGACAGDPDGQSGAAVRRRGRLVSPGWGAVTIWLLIAAVLLVGAAAYLLCALRPAS